MLPLYLINALGLSVMGAGLVLAAMALGAFGSGAAARHVAARYGAPGTVLQDVPVTSSGTASATQKTVRQVGSALGTAVAGAVLSVALAATLPSALEDAGITGPQATQVAATARSSAGTSIDVLRGQGEHGPLGTRTGTAVEALSTGFADATRWSLLSAVVFLALGLIGALQVRRAGGAAPRAPRGQRRAPRRPR